MNNCLDYNLRSNNNFNTSSLIPNVLHEYILNSAISPNDSVYEEYNLLLNQLHFSINLDKK